ncbi:DUF4156 domain-containing protein [Jiella sp. M17.18]|uniref:DUF4156 domain-containing protein n=1 Tax=Jiella sp. M17.18 TaxID=3234247 RepID=UPI0034DE3572
MRALLPTAALALLSGLAGCVSTQPGPDSVNLVKSQSALSECRYITTVYGNEAASPESAGNPDAPIQDMRRATAALGGNTLYVGATAAPTSATGPATAARPAPRTQGDAYHC